MMLLLTVRAVPLSREPLCHAPGSPRVGTERRQEEGVDGRAAPANVTLLKPPVDGPKGTVYLRYGARGRRARVGRHQRSPDRVVGHSNRRFPPAAAPRAGLRGHRGPRRNPPPPSYPPANTAPMTGGR